jgi:hypothetical protein
MLYLVEFTGPFGFLRPWTAVRDGKTNSLTFLTPSTLEGIRQKLGVTAIARYRLSYAGIDWQQEMTHARGWTMTGTQKKRLGIRPRAILLRGVLLLPRLTLAFAEEADAQLACHQHLCLSRNEDVLFPDGLTRPCSLAEFEQLPGSELVAADEEDPGAVLVGHNRYQGNAPMFGRITTTQALATFGAAIDPAHVH